MLVLTRKVDEEVVIDERITVRFLGCHGGRIRLGITAPQDVSIRRAELQQAIDGMDVRPSRPVGRPPSRIGDPRAYAAIR